MLQSSHNRSPLFQQRRRSFSTQVNGAIDVDRSRTQSLRSHTQRPHTRTIDTGQFSRTHTRRLVRDRSLRRLGLHRCDALCDGCVVLSASQSTSIASFFAFQCSHRSACSFLFASMTTNASLTTTDLTIITAVGSGVYIVNSIVVIASGGRTRMREWPDVVDYVQEVDGGDGNDDADDDDDVDDKRRDVDIDVPLGDDLIRHEKDEYYVDVDDDEEREDDRILPTDVVLLTANTDSEAHSLVVTVFDDIDDLSWYNHHDYFLASLPVSVEWLDFSNSGVDGSFAAVGSRHSFAIEVWNLDVMNAVEVAWTLGDVEQKTRQSTIALAWNPLQRKLLASGSTDNSLSLWDVRHTAAPVYTSNNVHSGGVQALAWNPASDSQLLSAAFDQVALLHDARTPQQPVSRARLENEPESVKWLSAEQPIFIVAEEKGRVEIFDARNAARPLLSFEAHSAPHAVTGLAVSHVPTPSGQTLTVVATCSTDTTVKLWNMTGVNGAAPPPLIHSKTTGTPLFCLDFCRDAPTMLACGGETGFAGSNIANELANL